MTETCPFCQADLRGEPIPEEYFQHNTNCEEQKAKFGGHCFCLPYGEEATHFSRLLGIEIPGVYDGILMWQCPDCGTSWPRFDPPGRRYDEAIARGAKPLP